MIFHPLQIVNSHPNFHRMAGMLGAGLIGFLLLTSSRSFAHEPGLSTLAVQLRRAQIDIALVVSARDARELWFENSGIIPGGNRNSAAVERSRTVQASDFLEVSIDGQAASLGDSVLAADDNGNVVMRSVATGRPGRSLAIRTRCFARLPAGHRQFLSIRAADDTLLAERLLSAGSTACSIETPLVGHAAAPVAGVAKGTEFVGLGLKHILLGYDHLLFLFSLLVVSRNFMPTLRIVTCFTVAHSISLALSTLNVVAIPSRIVEPLIAASIVLVAVENIVRRDVKRGRLLLVFGFGLIHGLGFASVLRELGVGDTPSRIIMPLLSFNLGVELGQLLVVILVAPVLYWAGRIPSLEKRLVPVCSTMVAGAGLFWLVERLFGSA